MSHNLTHSLLGSLDLKILTVQRTEAGRWWNYRNVISPFSRFWLILKGQATVTHGGVFYQLVPGSIHLVPAFTRHDCSCSETFDHYHMHFSARLPTGIDLFSMLECACQLKASRQALSLCQRLDAIYPSRKLPCFDPSREEYKRLSARLESAAHEETPSEWLESQGIMRLLLAPFLDSARFRDGVHARASHRFLAVQEFIQEHMGETISLADMARVAGLNPTYFSDVFDETVGMRPTDYLIQRRMERAQYLLLTSRDSVKQIAFQVGIPDAAYFTRLFTRLFGISPTAYRRTQGG